MSTDELIDAVRDIAQRLRDIRNDEGGWVREIYEPLWEAEKAVRDVIVAAEMKQ